MFKILKIMFLFSVVMVMLSPAAMGQIVINEFAYDDSGTDDQQFVELYNAGASAVDISGYYVIFGDSNVDATATIPASTTLAAGDFYVVGNSAVPNVDLVTSINPQNDMEFISVLDSSQVILDSVVYERSKNNVLIPAGHGEPASDGVTSPAGNCGGFWANGFMGEAGDSDGAGLITSGSPNASISTCRYLDGYDTDDNANDFGYNIATPGEPNHTYGTIDPSAPYGYNFDGQDNEIYPHLPAAYNGEVRMQDPTVADSDSNGQNPAAIPVSPQGGNVLCLVRSGGNSVGTILNLTTAPADIAVELYGYIDEATESGDHTEYTNFMTVRGRAGAAFHDAGLTQDPRDGICWICIHDVGGATLSLEQRRDNATVKSFATIPITPGVNDGWQRFAIEVNGENVVGVFGGNLADATASGTVYSGTTTLTRGGCVGMGSRVSGSGFAVVDRRLLTIDAIRIAPDLSQIQSTPVKDWDLY